MVVVNTILSRTFRGTQSCGISIAITADLMNPEARALTTQYDCAVQ